jgi:hypothetical protein
MKTAFLLTLALATGLFAQPLTLPPKIEALSKIACETVNVTVDENMMRFADAKGVLRGLKKVYVRVFEFDRVGAYSASDLDELHAAMRKPGWSQMVDVKSRDGENVNVYVRNEGVEITGMVVVAAEAKELTIVQIEGPIRPEDLASVPHMNFWAGRRR